jgi:hypothetical protein
MNHENEEAVHRIDVALIAAEPGLALRNTVKEWLNAGVEREVVLQRLEGARQRLRDENREEDEDVVMDVMDLLLGWSGPDARL